MWWHVAVPVLLKPFVLLALFLPAALLSHLLRRFIPEGRVKRWLYKVHPIMATTDAERRDWTLPVAWFVAFGLIMGWIWWLGGGRFL